MEKGEIGKPILLHFLTVCPTLQPWVAGQGGRLWEVGIHRIYLSQYLFGRVHKAELHRMGSSEENVLLKLNSEKGMCEIHIVSEFDGPPETLAIVGTKGQISIGRLAMGPVVVQKPMANWRGIFVETVGHDLKSLLSLTGLAIRNLVCGATVSPHHFIINNFLETIAGRAELFVKPEEGLQALEVLERTEE
jgi:predicted dehydrogenase